MAKATALALATVMTLTAAAAAQDWPTRPVTMVVPFTAGGPVDVAARLIAPRVSESLGQQIVVENMGGACGMTGSNRVAKAAPDGYLLVLGNGGTHAYNQSLYKKPLYNSESDFAPVGVVVENTKVLIVRNDFPANSLPEFVAYVKANQDKLQYASAGAGSATHIACLLLNYRMRTNVTHVPYRGAGPALQDLIAGRIDFMCEVISTGLPPIQSKLVKPIALLSTRRASVLPQLPTALEQGLPDVDADGWNALGKLLSGEQSLSATPRNLNENVGSVDADDGAFFAARFGRRSSAWRARPRATAGPAPCSTGCASMRPASRWKSATATARRRPISARPITASASWCRARPRTRPALGRSRTARTRHRR